jgi:hypothetical protein
MGTVLDFPILPDSDLGRQLVVDMARYREGLLDEKGIRKRYRLADDVWEKLGEDDRLVRAIEDESVRRVRDGSVKREKAQQLVVKAPDVLGGIMNSTDSNDRHRIDACKALNDFAANGPAAAPAGDRFIIQINLGEDTIRFNKSVAPNADDIDPDADRPIIDRPLLAVKKITDDGNGQPV